MDHKTNLIDWRVNPAHIVPYENREWHKGAVVHFTPNKRELREAGLAAVARGWLPENPIITQDTRTLAVGSCFARNFTLWLAEHGFNKYFPESPYNALLRNRAFFESPAVLAQQFRWAFDELDPSTLLWIDKNKNLIEATEVGKQHVRATLEQTDVLILTLGLSEVWYDIETGEPLWRALTADTYDPARHVFRVESVAQTMEWLEAIERLRRKHLPSMKIVFTVSPIPLAATFRPVSAVTANEVSKAILKAALDEFLRRHIELVNDQLYYFPSYEMVRNFFMDPYEEDNRHVNPIVSGAIVAFFARHFCVPQLHSREAGSLAHIHGGEAQERFLRHAATWRDQDNTYVLLARIADLEEDKGRLQQICDERQVVIDELDTAARERLELINRLDAQLKAMR